MVIDAARAPVAVGVNVAVIEHVPPIVNVAGAAGQFVLIPKSLWLAPASATAVIVSGAVPLFVNVDDCGALVTPKRCNPKARLAGLSFTPGAVAVPVPERGTLCGLSAALSLTIRLAAREPAPVGVNAMEIVHVAPGANVDGASGQSALAPKSEAFVPVVVMLEIASAAPPVFLRIVL